MALIVVAIIAIGGLFFPLVQSAVGAVANRLPHGYWDTADGYYVDGTVAIDGSGVLTNNTGRLDSYSNATSSSVATYTLVAADLGANGTCFSAISFTKTGAVATTTWTFPASSTMSTILPSVGDRCSQMITVATSSPTFPGLTLAAGTGIDLETSSTTASGLTINGGSNALIEYVRRADSDISAAVTIFRDAD